MQAMEDWPLHVGGFVARYLLMTYAVFAILSRGMHVSGCALCAWLSVCLSCVLTLGTHDCT